MYSETTWKKPQRLRKSPKEFTDVNVQNKTNGPLVRIPHFQNKMGGNSQHLQKSSITNVKLAIKGIKIEDCLVRKYSKKATFFFNNIPQLKQHSKEEIYIKETVPLPLSVEI